MTVDPEIQFYMKVPLGDGTFTNGRIDYTPHPHMLGIDGIDLSDTTVLDIAANDGYCTFRAEQRGATEFLAIDIDGFENYEWGWEGPPASVEKQTRANAYSQWSEAGRGFMDLHQHFGSVARRATTSVYELDPDVHGQFDLIFHYGLLSHLRYPLLSLDRTRAVCSGALILETHVVTNFRELPLSLFYFDDAFRVYSNRTGPTEAMVAAWLRSAGFDDVWVRRPARVHGQGRAVFVASVSGRWAECFDKAPGLLKFDDAYRRDSRRQMQVLIDG